MNQLENYFGGLLSKGKKLFLPYITLGDPDLEFSYKIIKILSENGASAIEIGIPFSDPIADGPTIQKAVVRALKNRITLKSAFKVVKNLKRQSCLPLLFMSYYNPILRLGEDNFLRKAKESGLDGVIIPDLSIEEAEKFVKKAKKSDLACVFFISPTTPPQRIKRINHLSSGFVYFISLTGVTGAREKLPRDLIKSLKIAKKLITKPLCVGFGISKPKQVKEIKRYSDGIIIGSAIINIIERNLNNRRQALREISEFSKKLRSALDEKDPGS